MASAAILAVVLGFIVYVASLPRWTRVGTATITMGGRSEKVGVFRSGDRLFFPDAEGMDSGAYVVYLSHRGVLTMVTARPIILGGFAIERTSIGGVRVVAHGIKTDHDPQLSVSDGIVSFSGKAGVSTVATF